MTEDLDESELDDAIGEWLDAEDAAGSPETAEASAETAADAETRDAPIEANDRGDGRDAKGRFAPKGAESADSPEAPPANADASAQPMPGSPEVPPADAGTVPAEPPQENADALEVQPLVVRVGQQDHAIPGAVVTPHGAVIPPESLQHLHEVYGRGIKYEAERQHIKTEKAQLAYERETHGVQMREAMREWDHFVGLARAVGEAKDEQQSLAALEALAQYGLDFIHKEPLLRERMDLARERAEIEVRRRSEAPDPEMQATQLRQATEQQVVGLFQQMQQAEPYKALTERDYSQLLARVHQEPQRYLRRAGERLTQEEAQAGVEPGELYFHQGALLADADLVAQVRREAQANEAKHRQALSAVQKAQEENQKRAAAPKVQPPKPKPAARPMPAHREEVEDLDEFITRELSGLVD